MSPLSLGYLSPSKQAQSLGDRLYCSLHTEWSWHTHTHTHLSFSILKTHNLPVFHKHIKKKVVHPYRHLARSCQSQFLATPHLLTPPTTHTHTQMHIYCPPLLVSLLIHCTNYHYPNDFSMALSPLPLQRLSLPCPPPSQFRAQWDVLTSLCAIIGTHTNTHSRTRASPVACPRGA